MIQNLKDNPLIHTAWEICRWHHERCYKKAFDHDTALKMILEGQCGQFNPVLLKCLKELSRQFAKMFMNKRDDNKQYYEAQRISDEILRERSLPRKNYSQRVINLMQEKIDFFKTNLFTKISKSLKKIFDKM